MNSKWSIKTQHTTVYKRHDEDLWRAEGCSHSERVIQPKGKQWTQWTLLLQLRLQLLNLLLLLHLLLLPSPGPWTLLDVVD